jgi:hypothetical protein
VLFELWIVVLNNLIVNRIVDLKLFHHRQFHLLKEALALVAGPFALATTPDIRAQNDFLRPASFLVLGLGAGALSLLPVSLLYLALPFAVKPAPSLTDCFSPRPIDRETPFLDIGPSTFPINNQGLLPGFLSFLWNREVNPFIKFSNDLLKR